MNGLQLSLVVLFFLSLLELYNTQANQNNAIEQVGHLFTDIPNQGETDGWGKYTFLVATIPREGVLFGLSGWFLSDKGFHVQIWRPNGTLADTYSLQHQWYTRHSGPDYPSEKIIQGGSFDCFRVLPGDRLGITFRRTPIPIAHRFVNGRGEVNVHRPEVDQGTTIPLHTQMLIKSLNYPYQFSLAAFVDYDLSSYSGDAVPSCRVDIPLPLKTIPEPTPPIETGPRGFTGPTGPQGFKGEQGPKGELGLRGYTGLRGPKGVRGSRGPSGEIGLRGPSGPSGPRGREGPIGTPGIPGKDGLKGDPGKDGLPGNQGETGPRGVKGERGPTGPESHADFSRMTKEVGDCEWCWQIYNPYILLTSLIWIVVLTLILVVFLCVYCCRRSCCKSSQGPGSKETVSTGFDPTYDRTIVWEGHQNDMWKYDGEESIPASPVSVEEDAQSKDGYNCFSNSEDIYSSVQEGRTVF